jgi:hypothetical protein
MFSFIRFRTWQTGNPRSKWAYFRELLCYTRNSSVRSTSVRTLRGMLHVIQLTVFTHPSSHDGRELLTDFVRLKRVGSACPDKVRDRTAIRYEQQSYATQGFLRNCGNRKAGEGISSRLSIFRNGDSALSDHCQTLKMGSSPMLSLKVV